MTTDAWITAAAVLAILIGLVFEIASPAVLVFGGVVALLAIGVIDVDQAFSGFSNPAPFTVGALFIVGFAVSKTAAIRPFTQRLLGKTGITRRPMLRMLAATVTASAFFNNIPLVAMMIPEIQSWARRRRTDPARFLLPLSYGAILGGLLTIIGTSTNLVVAGQMVESGIEPMDFFEIGRIGLPIALIGGLLTVALSPRFLGGRRTPGSRFRESGRDYWLEVEVETGGVLEGLTVEEAGLRHLEGVFLTSIDRGDTVIAPAQPTTVLRGGNVLRFVGQLDRVLDLQSLHGLRFAEQRLVDEMAIRSVAYFTAAIGGDSPLVGQTLQSAGFRSQYQAAVIAIHRAGERIDSKLGTVTLRVGDALILVSDRGFKRRWDSRRDFLVITDLADHEQPPAPGGLRTIAIVTLMVILAATGLVPILLAALLAVFLLIAIRVITPGEARRALDLEVLGVIASAFGLAAAVDESGLAGVIASGLTTAFGWLGETGVLLGVVLATIILTELVTNNAAALLVFPIAVSAAGAAGIEPRGMAVAVAIGASASFLTPIGYQTNTMVYGPGGYRFGDYLRVGTPITVAVIAVLVWLVPVFYGA